MNTAWRLALLLSILPLVGCSPYQSRTYEISVRNDSSKPLVVWLTKNGPAYERGWKAPEDLAIESLGADEPVAGLRIPVGKTGFTGKVKGQFHPRADAILRIYIGEHSFNELLAISRDSPMRTEVTLAPGANNLVITDGGPGVKVSRQ